MKRTESDTPMKETLKKILFPAAPHKISQLIAWLVYVGILLILLSIEQIPFLVIVCVAVILPVLAVLYLIQKDTRDKQTS